MVLTSETAAAGLGLLAAGLLVGSPLISSPRRLLQVQTGVGLACGAHFLLLGIVPAAAMNGLAAVQSVAALVALRRTAFGTVGYGIIPVMWVAGALFWSGPLTLLAVAAVSVVALARMMTREVPMRLTFLAGSVLWFAHDVQARAWIPLTADVLCGVIGLGMILNRLDAGPAWMGRAAFGGLRGLRAALAPRQSSAARSGLPDHLFS